MAKIEFYGKQIVYNQHLTLSVDNLLINKEKSFNSDNKSIKDNNLVIKGDNLQALKALVPYYRNRIDIIYIDPPYNTGAQNSEGGFVYNDNMDNPLFDKWINENFINKEDMSIHDKWLCFMWVRLQLAKELMSENGVIFISIDENENHRLRMIMDEIFGEYNFIADIVWKKTGQQQNNGKNIATTTEYIYVYAKKLFDNNNNKKKQLLSKDNLLNRAGIKAYRYEDEQGKYRVNPIRHGSLGTHEWEYINPISRKKIYSNQWMMSLDDFKKRDANEEIHWGSGNSLPQTKTYLKNSKGVLFNNIIDLLYIDNCFNEQSATDLKSIFGEERVFNHSKPLELIKKIIKMSLPESTILDFFGGSGTTAQAVLELNKEDNGNRKFIIIEQMDYIDTITTERIKKTNPNSSFNYFYLEPRVKKERMFTKNTLPSLNELQKQLNINIFSDLENVDDELKTISKQHSLYQLGKRNNDYLLIMYKNDWDWLSSNRSSITEEIIDMLKELKDADKIFIYSTSRFVSHEDLIDNNINFLRLPLDI